MTWLPILAQIFEVCVVPLLGVLVAYLVNYIKTKSTELTEKSKNETMDKYINMLAKTIEDCVVATNQTYVSSLKKDNLFTAEAQKEAFQKTYDAVMNVLTDDAKEYLSEAYGDLNTYITQKIEAEVAFSKIIPCR